MPQTIRLGAKIGYFEAHKIGVLSKMPLASTSTLHSLAKDPRFFGDFWSRQLIATSAIIRNGKDVRDESSQLILRLEDLKAASQKNNMELYNCHKKFGGSLQAGILLLIDAKDFSDFRGYKVIEEPAITVITNAAPDKGIPDEGTKLAVMLPEKEWRELSAKEKDGLRNHNSRLPRAWKNLPASEKSSLRLMFMPGKGEVRNEFRGGIKPLKFKSRGEQAFTDKYLPDAPFEVVLEKKP